MILLSVTDLHSLLQRALVHRGLLAAQAGLVAASIAAAERDGTGSHGLSRLSGYLESLDCGWVNPRPAPKLVDAAPALVQVDADNGFAQIALASAAALTMEKARLCGMASLSITNSHHFAALWPDVEAFARQGLIALTMVNSRSLIITWGGERKILGTNPMAFACPREGKPPIVWDQASSVMSHGDVRLHAQSGTKLPPGMAVDRDGHPTTDPQAVLDGGALLSFGGAKGGSIAFMVEILAAAMTGGRFGFEDISAGIPGAKTSNAGQFVLLIDTARAAGGNFAGRIEQLVAALHEAGTARMPGDRRYARRVQSEQDGVAITEADAAFLHAAADGRI